METSFGGKFKVNMVVLTLGINKIKLSRFFCHEKGISTSTKVASPRAIGATFSSS